MTTQTTTEREEAIANLRQWLKPGDTITTVLRHASASGMTRSISLAIPRDGEIMDVSYWAGRALGDKIDQRHGGIKIGGSGMDMGFALVYNLSRVMFADGHGCIGEGCPSNDHSNGDRDYTSHEMMKQYGARAGGVLPSHWHADGGYALRQRWV